VIKDVVSFSEISPATEPDNVPYVLKVSESFIRPGFSDVKFIGIPLNVFKHGGMAIPLQKPVGPTWRLDLHVSFN
jgi:hypothetical protein